MFRHRRRFSAADRRTARDLVDEAVAITSGHLVEVLELRRLTVPCWAWINQLAHGSAADLERTAATRSNALECVTWRAARAYLAGAVLLAATAHGPLERIQRQVLIPLELQLAAPGTIPLRPGELVRRVVAALANDAESPLGDEPPRRS